MGAFGLNGSIMDAANLAWKLGLCSLDLAPISPLLSTYSLERRAQAARIIRVSGSYLRFVCNSTLPVVKALGTDIDMTSDDGPEYDPTSATHTQEDDLAFLKHFFTANGQFLLGLDAPYGPSVLTPSSPDPTDSVSRPRPIGPVNGVRAPNPRVCFSPERTGYLYDTLTGASTIHILLFVSTLPAPVATHLRTLCAALQKPGSWYSKYGGRRRFNIVVVTKLLPFELASALQEHSELIWLRENAMWLHDDRAPDEDAHTWYEVDRAKGAMVVVRPDLWVGESAFLDETTTVEGYLNSFLLPVVGKDKLSDGQGMPNGHTVVANGDATSHGHTKKTIAKGTDMLKSNKPFEGELSNGHSTLKVNISIEDSTSKADMLNEHEDAVSKFDMPNWDSPSANGHE